LRAKAYRCCVCKRKDVGFNLHHLDGNSSNSIDANLAVLCVEDLDHHHRPANYASKPNHTELGVAEILKFKTSWEQFVMEAGLLAPKVIATLSAYGTLELLH